MYLHYSVLSLAFIILNVLAVLASPVLALFKLPRNWAVEDGERGLLSALRKYAWRVVIWHMELSCAISHDWLAIHVPCTLIKQDGDATAIALYSNRQGRCFQLWEADNTDGDVQLFHYVMRKKWCKLFSWELEFGWDLPKQDRGGVFKFCVWPFRREVV